MYYYLTKFKAARIVAHIHHEMRLHIEYCSRFDVTIEEMESMEESQGKRFSFLKMMIELISLSLYCLYTVIFAYQLNQTDYCTNQDQICS